MIFPAARKPVGFAVYATSETAASEDHLTVSSLRQDVGLTALTRRGKGLIL